VRSLAFPSKTFVLGEYAILSGQVDAILLGHPPLFRAHLENSENSENNTLPAHSFHPESPAGKWLAEFPIEAKISLSDPHAGRGGFGGSGAEFLAAWATNRELPKTEIEKLRFAWQAWKDSRRFPGSGADILTQAYGVNREEHFLLKICISAQSLEPLPLSMNGELALFHTGQKLATHDHAIPKSLPLEALEKSSRVAILAIKAGDFATFAESIQAYGEKLAAEGLLAAHSAKALARLQGKKGVLAAKGCGAMGSDVILVAHRGADLSSWAAENSLAPIGNFPV
jgi:hypothetical protein